MDEYKSIEDYIRDDKFSKISPDAKSYKVQIKPQSSPSNDEKEPEKKQQQEKPKGGRDDAVIGPDMTCKYTKNRRPRNKDRLPSEVGKCVSFKVWKICFLTIWKLNKGYPFGKLDLFKHVI